MGRGYDNGKSKKKKKRKKRRKKYYKRIPKDRYISKKVRDHVRKRDNNKCVYCGKHDKSFRLVGFKVKRVKLEYGHVIPHSKGGDRCRNNIQMECKKCNRSKGTKIEDIGFFTKLLGRGAKGCAKHRN